MQLVSITKGDVFCGTENPLTDAHVTYCYGITAYCCGYLRERCCWDSIWKIWWFWVVVLVVLGALFSCIGYFCTCVNDDWSNQGRVSPLYAIRDGFRRRFSSTPGSADATDPYKDYREQTVLLPPYYPSTSSVPVASAAQTPGASSYPEAPPPYTEQPMNEQTPLLPVTTVASVVTSQQNPGTQSTVVDRTISSR